MTLRLLGLPSASLLLLFSVASGQLPLDRPGPPYPEEVVGYYNYKPNGNRGSGGGSTLPLVSSSDLQSLYKALSSPSSSVSSGAVPLVSSVSESVPATKYGNSNQQHVVQTAHVFIPQMKTGSVHRPMSNVIVRVEGGQTKPLQSFYAQALPQYSQPEPQTVALPQVHRQQVFIPVQGAIHHHKPLTTSYYAQQSLLRQFSQPDPQRVVLPQIQPQTLFKNFHIQGPSQPQSLKSFYYSQPIQQYSQPLASVIVPQQQPKLVASYPSKPLPKPLIATTSVSLPHPQTSLSNKVQQLFQPLLQQGQNLATSASRFFVQVELPKGRKHKHRPKHHHHVKSHKGKKGKHTKKGVSTNH